MISVDCRRSSTHMTIKRSHNMISNNVSLNFIKVQHQIFVLDHSTNVPSQYDTSTHRNIVISTFQLSTMEMIYKIKLICNIFKYFPLIVNIIIWNQWIPKWIQYCNLHLPYESYSMQRDNETYSFHLLLSE